MNTSVNLCGVTLKNPVMTASGTFGSGEEFSEFVDLNKLGAVVTKGVANVPWPGNPTPRVAEVYGGMLNAVGLQNPGIELFCKRDIPFLKQYDTKIIVNVCGKSTEDYCEVVERLADEPVDLLEINVSCPNVKEGGIAFGQNPHALEAITKEVKKYAKQPIIMKLSPNVTDITEMARAAERSTNSLYSAPEPKVPEAVITGFFNSTPARVTPVFIITLPPYSRIPVRLCRHVYCAPGSVHRFLLICRRRQDKHQRRTPYVLP